MLQDREYEWPKLVFGEKTAHKSKNSYGNDN